MSEFNYLIKSDKGYWLPQGMGYTRSEREAGRFNTDDLALFNLDGCTLIADRTHPARTSQFFKLQDLE